MVVCCVRFGSRDRVLMAPTVEPRSFCNWRRLRIPVIMNGQTVPS